jgi:hypothetical protein
VRGPDVARPLETARRYLERGWRCVPLPYRGKAPRLHGWQTLRLDGAALAQHFDGAPANVGVLLGEPSGGLVDVDLDCPEAIRLAPAFLPPTRSRFGRPSKRASHWLYVVTTPVDTATFADPDPADDATTMLVEFRSTGGQTVFPGSVHETGEAIGWDEDGASLRRAVGELAVACLLPRHWPAAGKRHQPRWPRPGSSCGVVSTEGRVVEIVHQAALTAGDDEATERKRDVLTTVARIAAGDAVTGGPTLAELLRGDGVKVVAAIRRWLGLGDSAQDDEARCTDVGNAARFVAQQGAHFRYVYAWSS